jgi:hypothetical protein
MQNTVIYNTNKLENLKLLNTQKFFFFKLHMLHVWYQYQNNAMKQKIIPRNLERLYLKRDGLMRFWGMFFDTVG